ncbi:MAG: SAM-dependent methyltransferase [Ruminococcaceae bacterium]|nr:SAM-dependent methyltransferase [Oscillospiraceae bacterium]
MAKVLQELDESHRIYQFTEGFSFGTDAVLLSGFITPKKNSVGVEFGSGTGIIPMLLCMHKEFQKIYSLEIQRDYAELARENLSMNGFSDKVEVIEGDLKDAKSLLPFYADFVFTNPPYMKKESGRVNDNEKKRIARHEIHCDIRDVCRSAGSLLQDKGDFYCVYRLARMAELFSAMREFDLEPKNIVFVTPKPHSSPDLILVRGVKGANPELKSRAPFVLQDETGARTEETRLLYEKGILEYGRDKG